MSCKFGVIVYNIKSEKKAMAKGFTKKNYLIFLILSTTEIVRCVLLYEHLIFFLTCILKSVAIN